MLTELAAIDHILTQDGYNLRSRHHLCADDVPLVATWLPTPTRLFGALLHLTNQRSVRRKELYETLFAMRALAPELGRARVVADVGAGHGLLGILTVLLLTHVRLAVLVDKREPDCYASVLERLAPRHPYVKTRLRYLRAPLHDAGLCTEIGAGLAGTAVQVAPRATESGLLFAGVHCCGRLTDRVAAMARAARAPFAVVPCCEARSMLGPDYQDPEIVPGDAVPGRVAAQRLAEWRSWGYEVDERALPAAVTGRRQLFVGRPTA